MLDIRLEAREVGQWHSFLEDISLPKGSELLRVFEACVTCAGTREVN